MTQQIIPLTAYPEQTFRLVLDNIPYAWRVYWSAFDDTIREIIGDGHEGIWYADIVGGGITINGAALLTGCDILGAFSYDIIGQLWLVDMDADLSDPTFESLGTKHQLMYVPIADVKAFNEAIGE